MKAFHRNFAVKALWTLKRRAEAENLKSLRALESVCDPTDPSQKAGRQSICRPGFSHRRRRESVFERMAGGSCANPNIRFPTFQLKRLICAIACANRLLRASSQGINLLIRNDGRRIEFLSEPLDKGSSIDSTSLYNIFSQVLAENSRLKMENDSDGEPIDYWYKVG